MYIVHCTMYNVQCTMYIVQCTMYNVHCVHACTTNNGQITICKLKSIFIVVKIDAKLFDWPADSGHDI